MCHEINILQLDHEEMEIMTSNTSTLPVLESNLVETNTKDALSSKSNEINVYQVIYSSCFVHEF